MIDRLALEAVLNVPCDWKWLTLPARDAEFAATTAPLPDSLLKRCGELGIPGLFRHQATCFDLGARGLDFLIASGTNSGKTLCFLLPALARLLKEPAARMLYLSPTKALARDQAGRFEAFTDGLGLRVGIYDGDTPKAQRGVIRREAHIILSNPDMVHLAINPNHESWIRFLRSLRVIVLDEVHIYRGVFGSHVANVLRRLLRLCEAHGNRPAIFAASGTIANPADLLEALVGRAVEIVGEDAAYHAETTVATVCPGPDAPWSPNRCSALLMAELIRQGSRVLAFSRSRIGAELLARYAREQLSRDAIETYRAGYTAKERKLIQDRFSSGRLEGLSATNALELGIDVGGLDAVIVNGFPGTRASFRQQAGRAGRGRLPGLVLYVANADPLDSALAGDPIDLAVAATEPAIVQPGNERILSDHLRCAAYERPIQPSELARFGDSAVRVAESLEDSGQLRLSDGRFFYPAHDSPALGVNIRGGSNDDVALILAGETLGTMERWRALGSLHLGAVYLHRGETYVVESLELHAGQAILKRMDVDYFTVPIVQSTLQPTLQIDSAGAFALVAAQVATSVIGFRSKSLEGGEALGEFPLDLPTTTLETLAVQIRAGTDVTVDPRWAGAIHACEHALGATAPMIAGCDRQDLGTGWYMFDPAIHESACYVFDRQPGGVGLAECLYRDRQLWLQKANSLLSSCPCLNGCPRCLLMPACESANEPLWKQGALALLESIANR